MSRAKKILITLAVAAATAGSAASTAVADEHAAGARPAAPADQPTAGLFSAMDEHSTVGSPR